MPKLIFASTTLILIFLLLSFACSTSQSPVSLPDSGDSALVQPDLQVESGYPPVSHRPMGTYLFMIDKSDESLEIVPVKTGNFHLNVTSVLNGTLGVSAAIVPGQSVPSQGIFVIDVTLSNPFQALQFSGFDVCGILMAPGTLAIGPLIFSDPAEGETRLLNADGYTRWWNPSEFPDPGLFGYTKGNLTGTGSAQLTANINPYKYFADILDPTSSLTLLTSEPLDNDMGRGIFRAGTGNTRRYEIKFPLDPAPKIIFGYAIDASWAPPTVNPPAEVPDQFPINANKPESYRIAVAPKLNSLYFDSETNAAGGRLILQINAYDWQGQLAGNVASEVDVVRVFSPDLSVSGSNATLFSSEPTVAKYLVDLTGSVDPVHGGDSLVAIRVGATGAGNYNQGFATAPDSPISSWNAITVDVADPDCAGDTSNDFGESFLLNLDDYNIEQLCAPTDYRDFWKMVIPAGSKLTGEMTLWCDEEPTVFGIYNSKQTLIQEVNVSGGKASFDMNVVASLPGTYYFRVYTQTSGQAFKYVIEPDVVLQDITPSNPVDVTPGNLYFSPVYENSYGDYVIYSGNYRTWVYDMSIPGVPDFTSYVDFESIINQPALEWPYLYVCDYQKNGDSYIDLVDLSDPANPTLTKSVLTFTTSIYSIAVWTDYLIVSFADGVTPTLRVYDIGTNPESPVFVSDFATSAGVFSLQIMDNGVQKGIVGKQGPDTIVWYSLDDVNNIAPPHAYTPVGASLRDFTIQGNNIFAIYSNTSNLEALNIYDLTGPHINTFGILGSVTLPNDDNCVAVSGNFAYTGGNDNTQSIVDVSNLYSPSVKGSYFLSNPANDVFEFNDELLLFMSGTRGINLTPHNDLGEIFFGGFQYGIDFLQDAALDGDSLFGVQAYGLFKGDVFSINLADPGSPYIEDRLMIDKECSVIEAKNGRIAAGTYDQNVITIDGTVSYYLELKNSINVGQIPIAMAMTDTNLYVGYPNSIVETFKLDSWPTLTSAGTVGIAGSINNLNATGSALYVAGSGGVEVYSTPNPDTTTYITTYTPSSTASQAEVKGTSLYLACKDFLEIADISNPLSPAYISKIAYPGSPNGNSLSVYEQYAIMSSNVLDNPTVFNIFPPDSPSLFGDLYISDFSRIIYHTYVKDDYFIETVDKRGLRIWDMN
jgi:hypothetical protein